MDAVATDTDRGMLVLAHTRLTDDSNSASDTVVGRVIWFSKTVKKT